MEKICIISRVRIEAAAGGEQTKSVEVLFFGFEESTSFNRSCEIIIIQEETQIVGAALGVENFVL